MIKIQAQISLEEWKKYQSGEEAIAYNRTPENEQYLQIVINEQELLAIEGKEPISFVIKKEE